MPQESSREIIQRQHELIEEQHELLMIATHANLRNHHHHHHHHQSSSNSNIGVGGGGGVGVGVGVGSLSSNIASASNANLNFGKISPFTASQVNAEPLLSTAEGSQYVETNLYVNGLIYCNGVEQITATALFPNGIKVTQNSPSNASGIAEAQVQYYKSPVCFSDIIVDRVRFVSDLGTSNNAPVEFSRPSPSNVHLPHGLFYDNAWTLSRYVVENSHNPSHLDHKYKPDCAGDDGGDPAILSNSKLLVSSIVSLGDFCGPQRLTGVSRLQYNGPITANDGNAYETFDPLDVTLFEKPSADVVVSSQSLNMKTGVLKTESLVESIVKTSCDVFVARHVPHALIVSLRITPKAPMSSLLLIHRVHGISAEVTDVHFENSQMSISISERTTVSMFIAHGRHRVLGRVACVTSYVFDGCLQDGLGMKVRKNGKAENMFSLNLLEPNVAARVHMLHVVICLESGDPVEEARRISLTLLSRESSLTRSVSRIREDHVRAWSDVWRTNLTLTPKCSASTSQKALASFYKKHIRLALYNLYSLTPCHSPPGRVDESSYPLMDVSGRVLAGGDLMLLPLLVELRPEVALGVLEFRWRNMDAARRHAESYGLPGAKIPSHRDSSRPDMDVSTSALVAISTWACYRLLRNRDWFRSKGYPMIREIADFLSAIVLENECGRFYTPSTTSLSHGGSHDNSFVNRTIVIAMKAAIEASWEMSSAPEERWVAIFHSLKVQRYEDKVVKFDARSERDSTYSLLEPLLLVVQSYALSVDPISIPRMLNFYKLNKTQDSPLNVALRAIAAGRAAQCEVLHLEEYERSLAEFVSMTTGKRWGSLNSRGFPDPLMSALLVSIVLHGATNLRVEGGVAETRFYYEEMRLASAITANMPRYWDRVLLEGAGAKNSQTFRTLNNVMI